MQLAIARISKTVASETLQQPTGTTSSSTTSGIMPRSQTLASHLSRPMSPPPQPLLPEDTTIINVQEELHNGPIIEEVDEIEIQDQATHDSLPP